MTDDTKRNISRTIRELYLYPYRSKSENVIRGAAWGVSWLVGIVVQHDITQEAIGGAYFIFALSLLLEFVPESRNRVISRCTHGFFCILLFFMLLGSMLLIFSGGIAHEGIYAFLIQSPRFIGNIIMIMIVISVSMVLLEVHKMFYDEEEERRKKAEQYEDHREKFLEHLNGTSVGGNTL